MSLSCTRSSLRNHRLLVFVVMPIILWGIPHVIFVAVGAKLFYCEVGCDVVDFTLIKCDVREGLRDGGPHIG